MVQAIRDFAEGLRRRVGICVVCRCGRRVAYACTQFQGVIRNEERIEGLTWRCMKCGAKGLARYTLLDLESRVSAWPYRDRVRRKPGAG